MVKVRLTRIGRKNSPSYRIVAIESSKKRDGKYIEQLGYFNPSKSINDLSIDKKAVEKWVKNGAQVSEAVQKLLDGTYTYKPYKPNIKEEETKEEKEPKAETQDNEKKDDPSIEPDKENTKEESEPENSKE